MHTKEQIKAALEIMIATGQAIKEAGPNGLREGPLYATLQHVMTLHSFNSMIDRLVESGLVKRGPHFLLTWVEPCDHDFQEQPGEPPVDVCPKCGEVRR